MSYTVKVPVGGGTVSVTCSTLTELEGLFSFIRDSRHEEPPLRHLDERGNPSSSIDWSGSTSQELLLNTSKRARRLLSLLVGKDGHPTMEAVVREMGNRPQGVGAIMHKLRRDAEKIGHRLNDPVLSIRDDSGTTCVVIDDELKSHIKNVIPLQRGREASEPAAKKTP